MHGVGGRSRGRFGRKPCTADDANDADRSSADRPFEPRGARRKRKAKGLFFLPAPARGAETSLGAIRGFPRHPRCQSRLRTTPFLTNAFSGSAMRLVPAISG